MRTIHLTAAVLFLSISLLLPIDVNSEVGPDLSGYGSSGKIILIGDLALKNMTIKEDWPGNGTAGDPYIIEGSILESNWSGVGLYLDNISKHLEIRDCVIQDIGSAFFTHQYGNAMINNSSNITFTNCTFLSSFIQGLRIEGSSNCTIRNNSFQIGRDQIGMVIEYCKDMIIESNHFEGLGSVGISIGECSGSLIRGNTMSDISYGFSLIGLWDSTVVHNTIMNVSNANLVAAYLWNVSISDNSFGRVDHGSMQIYEVFDCKIERNEFQRTSFGLSAYWIYNSTINDNTFRSEYRSITLLWFNNMSMSGNRMWNSSIQILGDIEDFNSLKILPDNEVNDKELLFIKDVDLEGKEIAEDVGVIFLVNVSNAVISGRTMKDTYQPINLIGCEDITVKDCTLDDNPSALYAFHCNRLRIENVQADVLDNGMVFEKVFNSTIVQSVISSGYEPLSISNSRNISVIDNLLTSAFFSINIRDSEDCVVKQNSISGGLTFSFSYRNAVQDNIISDGDLVIPENVLWDPGQPEISNNTINGMRQDYILNKLEENIQLPEGSKDLILFNLTRCQVPQYEIEDGVGVRIIECSDVILNGWKLESCRSGFDIKRSFRVKITNSEVHGTGNEFGFSIWESISCRLEGNHISGTGAGIVLDNCLGPEVFSNEISGMDFNGIWIMNQTREFTVIRNEVSRSRFNGILVEFSWEGLISGNILIQNEDYGMQFTWSTERNLIYNNHFIENHNSNDIYRDGSRQAYDQGAENIWYYESPDVKLGNYWADMQGPDKNDDGIADPEYYIDGYQGSYDLYPMIEGHEPDDDPWMKAQEFWLTLILICVMLSIILMVGWKLFNSRNG